MEPMTRLPCVPCPGLHPSTAVSDSALPGGVRTGASCCLKAPPRTPSRSWPPAWVTWPSGHPCSGHFVAPGPHAALSAAALPPQGCFIGPLPWSSPQTLEAPSLRGPHSRCAARPLLSLGECLSSCSTNITTAWNVPPRPHSRHLPHLLSLSPPPRPWPVPGERRASLLTRLPSGTLPPSPVCPAPQKPLGSSAPLPGPGCHPGPPPQARRAQPRHGQTQLPSPHCSLPSPTAVTP